MTDRSEARRLKAKENGWVARRYATIMSGVVIRWRPEHEPWENAPEVNASRDGVGIGGVFWIMRRNQLHDLRAALDLAEAVHVRLAAGDECEEFKSAPFGGDDAD